jgi:hypothetical protein
MQSMAMNLEHVVLALADVDKKIMDVEDGYTLQHDIETNNGFANIQLNEDALLLQGIILFDIYVEKQVQTTVKIYRDKCSILHCETLGGYSDFADSVLREILQRYYAIQKN